jgi:hypothetical protein
MWTWAESNRRPDNPYYKDNVCLIYITSASEFWHIDSFIGLCLDYWGRNLAQTLPNQITNYQTGADRSHPLHHFIYVEERVALLGKTLASLLYTFAENLSFTNLWLSS